MSFLLTIVFLLIRLLYKWYMLQAMVQSIAAILWQSKRKTQWERKKLRENSFIKPPNTPSTEKFSLEGRY